MRKKIPLKAIPDEYEKFNQQLHEVTLPSGFSEFLLYVLSEMFSNISEHSEATLANLLVRLLNRQCAVEIGDNGIGLRSSYEKKEIYPKDDFAAIQFALSGLSTKNFKERGYGFYSTRKLVSQNKGKLYVYSGIAKVEITHSETKLNHARKKLKGVSVRIEIPVRKIDFYKFIE